jgi:putative ABC transport system permease protein
MLRSLRAGLHALLYRRAVSGELDEELQHYLEQAIQENLAAGMTPEAAAHEARVRIGSVEATKEEVRGGGWEAHIESALRDLRYGIRALRRNPSFTIIAVATLALGIGVTTTMFSVVNAVVLRPLPYPDADQLTLIWTDDVRRGLHREATGYPTITDWRTSSRAFQDIAFYSVGRATLIAAEPGADPGRSRNAFVSGNLFSLLGTRPAAGRGISPADERDRAEVVVISHGLWQRWFGGAAGVVGRSLTIQDVNKGGPRIYTVIGVMPPGFFFPDQGTELWIPATTYWRFDRESTERVPSWARRWTGLGRLAPGASVDDARTELAATGRRLTANYPSSDPDFTGYGTTVLSVLDSIAGQSLQSSLWLMLGAVTLVLLVACVNVANLLLARGAARQQEFAVRRALGGGRARLVRQLVTESMLLALLGGSTGMLLAAWGTSVLGRAAAAYVPRISETTIDARVLVFALVASLLAGLAFGLVPALRLSAADAAEALKEGGRGTGRAGLKRHRDVLVVAECSLALVLLTGAGLLLRSLQRLESVDPGFDTANVLTMRLEFLREAPLTAQERAQPELAQPARARVRDAELVELIRRLEAIPGVESAGFGDDLFLNSPGNESITIPGRPMQQLGAGELTEGSATPGFFPTLRVPLRQGRYLAREDAARKVNAMYSRAIAGLSLAEKERLAVAEPVVVNEAFVGRYFPGGNPLGKRFCIDPEGKTYWYEIVGVVGDMHRQGLERATIPQYFGPYIPTPNGRADLLVRTSGDPMALAAVIRQSVKQSMPGVAVAAVSTADAQLGGFSAQRRFQTWLLTTFALLALMLAAVGIFGLVHYAIAERTREIGVRVALGATPRDVLRLTLFQGMRSPMLGIAIGLLASAALTRVIGHLLFGVTAGDPVTFVAVAGVLAAVAVMACYLAGRRAVRVDPMAALRGA